MPGETPITTATARILIVPDLTEFEEAKRRIETDIEALGEKFKDVFKVNLDDFADKIAAEVEKLGESRGGDDAKAEQSGERVKAEPDQVLAKLTEIQESIERLVRSQEELVEALTTRT